MITLASFYKSDRWRDLLAQLKIERTDENGDLLCEHCGKPITRAADCIGHHKVELTEANVNDYEISLNPSNIALIHFRCHNVIHQRFEGFRQQVFLVYGSPCSGKTTWVRENANADDLILDIDAIWECVCTSDRYHKPNRLKANVFGIRDCILDQIKTRQGRWRNAYIVGGYPLASERERLCDLLGAREVFIEADKETCLARAENEAWKGYVCDWFDSFTPPHPSPIS